jgi:hypothetical protein
MQSTTMGERVGFFRLGSSVVVAHPAAVAKNPPAPVAPIVRPAARGGAQAALARKPEHDWEEF